jgi:hypothetical protein
MAAKNSFFITRRYSSNIRACQPLSEFFQSNNSHKQNNKQIELKSGVFGNATHKRLQHFPSHQALVVEVSIGAVLHCTSLPAVDRCYTGQLRHASLLVSIVERGKRNGAVRRWPISTLGTHSPSWAYIIVCKMCIWVRESATASACIIR